MYICHASVTADARLEFVFGLIPYGRTMNRLRPPSCSLCKRIYQIKGTVVYTVYLRIRPSSNVVAQLVSIEYLKTNRRPYSTRVLLLLLAWHRQNVQSTIVLFEQKNFLFYILLYSDPRRTIGTRFLYVGISKDGSSSDHIYSRGQCYCRTAIRSHNANYGF